MSEVDQFLASMKLDGKACPMPDRWNTVWKMLPGREKAREEGKLMVPLILGGWHESNYEDKRERFETHLRYAEEHGVLDRVFEYLQSLSASDWHGTHPGGDR